ncbi:glycosyltransferase family 4 protein [Bacillus sinesaloumensis]|uniref:glycosyltransferase family 4 protein n=1 Tax=Litchfieldia sinesaloumensis TaxID=1926280 RepID=UPI00098846C8|nr:glycosyltransferase family 4 protein [Bacillus sinesaloumensis]
MNILLVNHYAGSNKHGMEYRPYYLSREWVKMGHKVTIIASSYSHVRTKQPEITEKWTNETIDGIDYIWVETPLYDGNGAKRVLNIFSFVKDLYMNASKIVKEISPDIVIASSTYPLDIYPASKIAKMARAKLIFEVHDLWPLTPMELGNMSKFHPFIMTMQKGENDAYKKADMVVSLLPKAKEHMISHGMDPAKFQFLPNGIVTEDWENANEEIPKEHIELITKLKNEGKFLVGYAGTQGIANALEYLLDVAKIMQDKPISFVLVGKGTERDSLIQRTKEMGLTNIHFLPVINKDAIPDFLTRMDALYIGWRRSTLYRFGVSPNKLLDYMMASKPIIHSIEAGNDLVKEANCGVSVAPEDPVLISEAIQQIFELTDEERKRLGANGKKFVMENHDYRVLAERFIKLMNQ